MLQNLVWATGYNVLAIPLAAGVLALGLRSPDGRRRPAMSVSTIVVAANAQLLRRLELRAPATAVLAAAEPAVAAR